MEHTITSRSKNFTVCLMGLCLCSVVFNPSASAHNQPTLEPFEADYQLTWYKGIKIKAQATRKLVAQNNHYIASLKADNIFASLTETSHVNLQAGTLKTVLVPTVYTYANKVFGYSSSYKIDFLWAQEQAHITSSIEAERPDVFIPAGTLDVLSLQLQLKEDVKRAWQSDTQSLPLQYQVITSRGDLVDYHFSIQTMEDLDTPAGKIASIKLARIWPNEPSQNQAFYLWYSPEFNFLMTGMEQLHADGEKLTMRLKAIRQ